ncbi:gamma-glutamylcyclotransferase family protein [Caballeronia sp.]|uniref:gamma-glutamylcyclotransferase family protein n=1 Tax=Caballeronia sp. TaxID=1931223 RepID=UPI003C62A8C7
MQYVFIYGTLRAGEINDISRAAERHGIAAPEFVGVSEINGRLYDFGQYPGLVLDATAGPVIGDVYRIDDALIPVLDGIEMIVPGVEGLYRVETVQAAVEIDQRREVIECMTYPVAEKSVKGCRFIEGGDWISYRLSLLL